MLSLTDVFVSYAREDRAVVERLCDALEERGRDAWVDWDSIPPTTEWMLEILGGIEAAHTFVFVLSPDSLASTVCRQEVQHAIAQNKRLVPLVCRDVLPEHVPDELSALNWIFVRPEDDFGSAVEQLIWALDTDLEYVRSHTRLLTRAIEWDRHQRDPSFVLQGSDLRAAERWLTQRATQRDPQPTALQTEYILASRAHAAQRQRTVLASLTGGLVVAILLAITAAFQWNAAARNRRVAQGEAATAWRRLYSANMNVAREAVQQGSLDRAAGLLQELVPAREQEDLRGWDWGYLWRRAHLDSLLLVGRRDDSWNVLFTPDGRGLATVSGASVRTWDLASGQELGETYFANLRLATDGTRPAPAHERPVRLGDPAHRMTIRAIAASPDGHHLATINRTLKRGDPSLEASPPRREASLWEAGSGREIFRLTSPDDFTSVAFSPDGAVLALGRRAGPCEIRSAATGTLLRTLAVRAVQAVAFRKDGAYLATAAVRTLALWDLRRGALLRASPLPAGAGSALACAPAGNRIAVGGEGGDVWVVEAGSGKVEWSIKGHRLPVISVAFSPDGTRLASGSSDGTAKVWHLRSEPSAEMSCSRLARQSSDSRTQSGQSIGITGLAFSPDSRLLATGSRDGTVRVWPVLRLARRPVCSPSVTWQAGDLFRLCFSPDGKYLAGGLGQSALPGAARMWQPESGKQVKTFRGHRDWVISVAFDRDGKRLVTGSEDGDRTARVWDVETGKELLVIKGHGAPILSATFSPDAGRVATASWDGSVRVWDANTGKLVQTMGGRGYGFNSVSFSPDGEHLALGGKEALVNVWDLKYKRDLRCLGHVGDITDLAFSADGKRLASSSLDGTIRLWDWKTGREVLTLDAGPVWSIAFSPDGRWLASGGKNGRVRLWEALVPASVNVQAFVQRRN